MNKESLGLNPNIRVEDEYIDNLMKQIHFMNLEINLLKQKQDESKDVMGIRALMQNDKNQYVDHIIETNHKFMNLLQDKAKEKIILDDKLLRVEEKVQKMYQINELQEKRHNDVGKALKDTEESLRAQVKDLKEKLQTDKDNRQELQAQFEKLSKAVADAKQKNEELTRYVGEKVLFDKIQKEVDEDEDNTLQAQISSKTVDIAMIRELRDTKLKLVNDDEKLKKLKETSVQLQEEMNKKQIEASDNEYKVMEIEARQQLAIKIKEKEAQERKSLFDEYERLKDTLDEEIKKNNERIEKKLRESSFEELGKRDIILRKTQEELNVLKVQYDKIHKEYKNFKLDELRKTVYYDKIKKENEE